LHAAGWGVGDAGFASGWLVTGTNGENRVAAAGATRVGAPPPSPLDSSGALKCRAGNSTG
jgi:hypothetical protein